MGIKKHQPRDIIRFHTKFLELTLRNVWLIDCKENFCQDQRSDRHEKVDGWTLCGLSSGKNCFVVKLDPHFRLQNDQN